MSRENFISDNLINIRERLRQDQGVQTPDSETFQTANQERQKEIPVSSPKMPSTLPAPAPRMQLRAPELDRERRELIGRIRRDYTLAAAELENMELKKSEAASFMDFLAKHQNELENIDFDRDDISRELDRLAWEYYQRSGRWRAFSADGKLSSDNSNQIIHAAPRSSRTTAIAILISAAMICATLLIVFL